jgi:apolipoprotein N-acyltransferase
VAVAPLTLAASLAGRRAGPPLRAFVFGIVAGMVGFTGTLYWVAGTMQQYGGLPTWLAVPVMLLLAAYLALYVGLYAVLVRLAMQRWGVPGLWLAPLFWVAAEWARSWVGGGFPWVLLGTSQARVLPIVQAASVVGVYGLSALLVLVSTAAVVLTLSRARRQRLAAGGVAVALVLLAGAGVWRVTQGRLLMAGSALRVGLVQGSIAQDEKYDPRLREAILTRYLDLSRQVIGEGAQLVVWPEASTPFYFDTDSIQAAPVRRLAAQTSTPFIIGTDEMAPARDGQPGAIYNSAVLVAADGRTVGSYRKMTLVPFGEYVPLRRLLFFVSPLVEAVGDFSSGTEAVVFDADGRRISVAICYESVYPAIARAFVAGGSQLLTTITNDAWFGRSSAAYQHFEQGMLRAVEQGRYMVRAANTGISGATDPYGRVLAATPLFEPTALTVEVRLLDGRTLYSRAGDVVVWIAFGAVAWTLIGRRAAGRRPPFPG